MAGCVYPLAELERWPYFVCTRSWVRSGGLELAIEEEKSVHLVIKRASIPGTVGWSIGLALLIYLGFLLRTILTVGSQKALGLGVFVEILVNPWYWATVVLVLALLFVWRLR